MVTTLASQIKLFTYTEPVTISQSEEINQKENLDFWNDLKS